MKLEKYSKHNEMMLAISAFQYITFKYASLKAGS